MQESFRARPAREALVNGIVEEGPSAGVRPSSPQPQRCGALHARAGLPGMPFDRHRRRALRNRLLALVGPRLAKAWVRTLRFRWTASDLEVRGGKLVVPRQGVVLVWHQRLFTLATRFAGARFTTLVSRHADGEMLTGVLEGLGHVAIRGSSTRGGVQAVREILASGAETLRLAVTPDGPRGPPFVLQAGSIYVASRTGLAIYPCAIGLERPWALRSWDRFWIPRPFSRALMHVGARIEVPRDLEGDELEAWRLRVESVQRDLNERLDRDFDAYWCTARPYRGFLE